MDDRDACSQIRRGFATLKIGAARFSFRQLLKLLRDRIAAKSARAALRIVAGKPLAGGAAVYVADIDGRRLVFAVSPHAIRLLASYQVPATPHADAPREEVARQAV